MNRYSKPYYIKVPEWKTPKELKGMSWQSLLMYHFLLLSRNQQPYKGHRISVPSTWWKKQFGRDYRKHLDDLIYKKWIKSFESYSNSDNSFTKAFKLDSGYWEGPFKDHEILMTPHSYNKFAGKFVEDSSDTSTPYLQLIKDRHDMVYMEKSPRSDYKRLKTMLANKHARISRPSDSRVYHTIISSDKKYRKYMIFGDRGKLVNIDVHAMVQQLLNREINNKNWTSWIQKDFHKTFMQEFGLKNRDLAKLLFMVAVSRYEGKWKLVSVARTLLYNMFPEIMKHVDHLNRVGSVAAHTQKMESKFIEDFIMSRPRLPMIPAHDGVFCGQKDADQIQFELHFFLLSHEMQPYLKLNDYSVYEKRNNNDKIIKKYGLNEYIS